MFNIFCNVYFSYNINFFNGKIFNMYLIIFINKQYNCKKRLLWFS